MQSKMTANLRHYLHSPILNIIKVRDKYRIFKLNLRKSTRWYFILVNYLIIYYRYFHSGFFSGLYKKYISDTQTNTYIHTFPINVTMDNCFQRSQIQATYTPAQHSVGTGWDYIRCRESIIYGRCRANSRPFPCKNLRILLRCKIHEPFKRKLSVIASVSILTGEPKIVRENSYF